MSMIESQSPTRGTRRRPPARRARAPPPRPGARRCRGRGHGRRRRQPVFRAVPGCRASGDADDPAAPAGSPGTGGRAARLHRLELERPPIGRTERGDGRAQASRRSGKASSSAAHSMSPATPPTGRSAVAFRRSSPRRSRSTTPHARQTAGRTCRRSGGAQRYPAIQCRHRQRLADRRVSVSSSALPTTPLCLYPTYADDPFSSIWLLVDRVSPTELTRIAGRSSTGHLFSQMPQPMHSPGST